MGAIMRPATPRSEKFSPPAHGQRQAGWEIAGKALAYPAVTAALGAE
tara:strand:- start:1 stop:141 length:141 start_codon:yes stop_codon:yes gene_type:complete